jgi:16S rRNA (guanine1207-N2)-methyltransferase
MGGLVTCVDASAAALQVTRETLGLNGVVEQAEVIASDSGGAVLGRRFDVVATNPPFHQGLGVDYDVARQFVRDAAHVLKPGGRLVLVANRFIRYEHVAAGLFSNVRTAYEDHRFRVLEAIK